VVSGALFTAIIVYAVKFHRETQDTPQTKENFTVN